MSLPVLPRAKRSARSFRDRAGGESLWSLLYEKPIDCEADVLRQDSQCLYGLGCPHFCSMPGLTAQSPASTRIPTATSCLTEGTFYHNRNVEQFMD